MVISCGTVTITWASGPGQGALTVAAIGRFQTAITINGDRPGPEFQGIGAISGGGGNSRLLIDYPADERTQILNYLFTPHFGASLQLLKLEIGGGGFSSDGSEPSIEPVKGQVDCGAGYEFWLAREAIARNPAIKLYGLQWTAPSWVRDGQGRLWNAADVGYVVDWLRCARQNGLTISYVGGWNEHYQGTPAERAWFVTLRAAMDAAGFGGTQIVAADGASDISGGHGRMWYVPQLAWTMLASDVAADQAFGRAVSVLGVHDICGMPTNGYHCVVPGRVRALTKPLWVSELGATPDSGTNPALPGPGGLARGLNDAYSQGGITGILVWPLLDAIPPDLPHENRGMVVADSPWDGSYQVTPLTWVIAQTTQFTAVGWRYADGADGDLPAGGSYVTYLAPDRSAWSMVAQTSVATAAQRLTVRVTGGLPDRVVHMWSTSLRGGGQFVHRGDIAPRHGVFTAQLDPGYVYTFTTTTGQSLAGGAAPAVPAADPMPAQYAATPDGAGMANLLAPIEGSFGYVNGALTQTTVGRPVEWGYLGWAPFPYAVVGPATWTDYTVTAHVLLPAGSSPVGSSPVGAGVIARYEGSRRTTVSHFRGYELTITSDGTWQLVANAPVPQTLASGSVAPGDDYTLSLTVRGSTISAKINGVPVASVTSTRYAGGPAGLASLGYYPVRYPTFTVG